MGMTVLLSETPFARKKFGIFHLLRQVIGLCKSVDCLVPATKKGRGSAPALLHLLIR